jgi:hypothetical protein
MGKKSNILLALILIAAIGVFVTYKFIFKANDDLSNVKPSSSFSFGTLMDKTVNDTSSLHELNNKVVAVTGNLLKMSKDSTSTTLEIGETNSNSSIICQIDPRYLNDFSNVKEGDSLNIKGKIAGFTIDTDLGLGNTIQMIFCVKNNP